MGSTKRGLTTPELVELIREHDRGRFLTDACGDSAGVQNIAGKRSGPHDASLNAYRGSSEGRGER